MRKYSFLIPVMIVVAFSIPGGLVFADSVSDTGAVQVKLEVGNYPSVLVAQLIDFTPPNVFNLSIFRASNSATVNWKTSKPALCQLFWGGTSEYQDGSTSEIDYGVEHIASFINLLPETTYHFQIQCRDEAGNIAITTDNQFTTLPLPDTTPPANVSDFKAIPGDSQIKLSWENPSDPDFKAVKIMRSTRFYPSDPWVGETVYNNKGTSFTDTGLTNDVTYYYTVFAYDQSENYASGAVVSAVPQKPEVIPPVIPPPPKGILPVAPPPPEIEKLTLGNFDFFQEGQKISFEEGIKIKTKTGIPLTISIDYEKVPEVLKIIMVTLEKDNKFFSFLLRINQEKTQYQAALMPAEEPGIYSLTITILDYKNQTIKVISGELEVERTETKAQLISLPWHEKIKNWILSLFFQIWRIIKDLLRI